MFGSRFGDVFCSILNYFYLFGNVFGNELFDNVCGSILLSCVW